MWKRAGASETGEWGAAKAAEGRHIDPPGIRADGDRHRRDAQVRGRRTESTESRLLCFRLRIIFINRLTSDLSFTIMCERKVTLFLRWCAGQKIQRGDTAKPAFGCTAPISAPISLCGLGTGTNGGAARAEAFAGNLSGHRAYACSPEEAVL